MTARALALRRLALVEKTRGLPPPTYDYAPNNRKQRRQLARELQKTNKRRADR